MRIIAFIIVSLLASAISHADLDFPVSFLILREDRPSRSIEYFSVYRPKQKIVLGVVPKKEPTRVELMHREPSARKEDDEFPVYLGVFSGALSTSGLLVLDTFLGSIGVSGYYIDHSYGFLILAIGSVIGFMYSYSTYVRKRAFAQASLVDLYNPSKEKC